MQGITARLRALMAEATPGPWSVGYMKDTVSAVTKSGAEVAYDISEEDAALIAESRNVLGELLAVVEAVAAIESPLRGYGECMLCKVPAWKHAPSCAYLLAHKLTGSAM